MVSSRIGRLSKSVLYNVLAATVTFGVNLALLPFIVAHIGKEIFGIFTLVMVFTGYLALFDFGLTGAIIKYVAEYAGRKEYDNASNVIGDSVAFLLIIGMIAAIFLISGSFWFKLIFKVTEPNELIVKELLWVAGLASIIIWPGKAFDAALQGFQFYGWIAIISVISSVLIGVLALYIFKNGYSIVNYLVGYYLITIMRNFSAYLIVGRKLNRYRLSIFSYPKKQLKKMLSFGTYLFFGSLTNIVILQFDNVLIGAFLSVSAVTIYTVVNYMQNILRAANSLLNGPLFPYYAELNGQGRYEEQRVFLLRGTKVMSLIFVSMVIITIIYARPIILSWMGEGFEESILPAQILISFWIVNGTLDVGTGMLTAKGFVKIPFFVTLINAICNLGLSLILIKYLGILGVVLGTTIPMILINFPCLVYLVNKVIGTSLKEYYYYAVRNNLIVYIYCAMLSFGIKEIVYPANLLTVGVEMAIIYAVTLLTGYKWFFSQKERAYLKEIVMSWLQKNKREELKSEFIG